MCTDEELWDSVQKEVCRHVFLTCWFACHGHSCPRLWNGWRFPSKDDGRKVLRYISTDFLQICLCTLAQEIMIQSSKSICMRTAAQWVMKMHQRADARGFKMLLLSLLYSPALPTNRSCIDGLSDSNCLSWNVINERKNITHLFWSFPKWLLLRDNQVVHDGKLFLVENHMKAGRRGNRISISRLLPRNGVIHQNCDHRWLPESLCERLMGAFRRFHQGDPSRTTGQSYRYDRCHSPPPPNQLWS